MPVRPAGDGKGLLRGKRVCSVAPRACPPHPTSEYPRYGFQRDLCFPGRGSGGWNQPGRHRSRKKNRRKIKGLRFGTKNAPCLAGAWGAYGSGTLPSVGTAAPPCGTPSILRRHGGRHRPMVAEGSSSPIREATVGGCIGNFGGGRPVGAPSQRGWHLPVHGGGNIRHQANAHWSEKP